MLDWGSIQDSEADSAHSLPDMEDKVGGIVDYWKDNTADLDMGVDYSPFINLNQVKIEWNGIKDESL